MTVCHVLREDPDLAEAIDPARRERAIGACVARSVWIPRGRWSVSRVEGLSEGIGLLVLQGLLLRSVGIEGRFGAELLGEGDLLRPWQGEDAQPTLTLTTGWRVLAPARVALLDEAAARRFADFPELTGRLVARALDRARNLAINMAIVHQARVNTRLQMLFWHLADRWGRVRSEGVILPLALTHTVLADLVAARRPTVTTALTELARQRLVLPTSDGWLLSGEPPGELLELQEVVIPAVCSGPPPAPDYGR
ncbi:MAG: helix-turn-helix domain-containing protein [Solirubrobacteraceae bacterium]